MGEWQTLVTMVTVIKWHRAVLSKEIVSQCWWTRTDKYQRTRMRSENGEDDDNWCEEEVSSVQCSLSLYTLRDLLVYHHRQWKRRWPLTAVIVRNYRLVQKDLENVGNKVCLNLVIQERHYISARTVLTLPKIQEICSVTFALTLERSHTHVKCVGGALLNLQITISICTESILQPELQLIRLKSAKSWSV